MRRLIDMALALGVLALLSCGFAILALADIYHGNEPDLSTEWMILRVTALLVLMFFGLAMPTLWKLRSKVW